MGWFWKDDDPNSSSDDDFAVFGDSHPATGSGDSCATRKVVKSECHVEEIEPGKFVRKCEKTEQIFKDCVGRPTVMVQSNKEYTEEDVTKEVFKGSALESADHELFNFPALGGDIQAIERELLGDVNRFFEAAEKLTERFFNAFGRPDMYPDSSPAKNGSLLGVFPSKEDDAKERSCDGDVDLSGLARDV